jgi:hypothetical protein
MPFFRRLKFDFEMLKIRARGPGFGLEKPRIDADFPDSGTMSSGLELRRLGSGVVQG